jgi:2-phosphosulfolactate phosphatase
MTQVLNVYALPSLATPSELAGGTAVVIDVLRASTTVVHALEAGADEVIPCLEVDDARVLARGLPRNQTVLGGERRGLPIPGFDVGNSPEEYTSERVGGKTIVFTTSNGTRAMSCARGAARILIAAFVNATAVYQRLLGEERIHLLCAGTDGQFSRDDVLLAGLLVTRLERFGGMVYQLNAQAMTARENWLSSFALPQALGAEPLEPERLAEELYKSPGGRNLADLGLDEDILAAAQIDHFDIVPELDAETFRIRLRSY